MKYSFRNDYSEIGHPKILKELVENAYNQQVGYGEDEITKALEQKIKQLTVPSAKILLTCGGTQTNLVVISKLLKPYEAVISVDTGHINVHETGAIEGTGHKVIAVSNYDGKIKTNDIRKIIENYADYHMVMPRMVYLSNSTEIGTTYTASEMKEIYNVCQELGLYLYIDGARLSNSIAAGDITLKDVAKYCDLFYLGGTKNGLIFGELLVIVNPRIQENFKYHQKNRGALLAKTFIPSMMFKCFLDDDLYITLAKNANDTKKYVEEGLKECGVEIVYPNNTNQLFVKLANYLIQKLSKEYNFEIWEKGDAESVVRLVTSWATPFDKCEEFIKDIKLLKA